ncbi:MAG: hypothetical protein LBI72_13380 [Flavobacteriaceae bacterium]|jgi:hypothetical protein|nr:hypothetical protein [Flavobacteriaceae bacterium]
MEYYKSYYLKEFNIVEKEYVEKGKGGIRSFYVDSLGIYIGEYVNSDNKIIDVIYYSRSCTAEIQDYHNNEYDLDTLMVICEELQSGVKLCTYNKGVILGYSIILYNEAGQESIFQTFDIDFKLVEYRELCSNSLGDLVLQKIFFANSWVIHEED